MNEHVEHFKRFAACYLLWANSNFDRIVADVVKRDAEAEAKRKEDERLEPYREQMRKLFINSNLYFEKMADDIMKANEYIKGTQWKVTDVTDGHGLKVGDFVKIKI